VSDSGVPFWGAGLSASQKPRPAAEYLPPHTRRVYEAVPERVWTNVVQEADGQVSDERILIDWASISTAR